MIRLEKWGLSSVIVIWSNLKRVLSFLLRKYKLHSAGIEPKSPTMTASRDFFGPKSSPIPPRNLHMDFLHNIEAARPSFVVWGWNGPLSAALETLSWRSWEARTSRRWPSRYSTNELASQNLTCVIGTFTAPVYHELDCRLVAEGSILSWVLAENKNETVPAGTVVSELGNDFLREYCRFGSYQVRYSAFYVCIVQSS